MLEQAKRPDSSPKRASVSGDSDSLLRRPMDREVDPFGLQLAVPENKRQTKKAGCSKCGGSATPCPTCGGNEDLETPPQVAKRSAEADLADPAERQADAIGAQIGAALPNHAVTGGSLSEAARSTAESHLGVDLGGTRIDGGSAGHAKAQSEDAWAVTEGSDIAFAGGQLQQNAHGRFLLGHELVHVAQQRAAKRTVPQRKGAGDESPTEVPAQQAPASAAEAAESPKIKIPPGAQVSVNGVVLVANQNFLEKQLEAVVGREGKITAAADFVEAFKSLYTNPGAGRVTDWGVTVPRRTAPSKADASAAAKILPKLEAALTAVENRMANFRTDFAIKAEQILQGLLGESAKRIKRERDRYGLHRKPAAEGQGGTSTRADGTIVGPAAMNRDTRSAGLRVAAAALAKQEDIVRRLEGNQVDGRVQKPFHQGYREQSDRQKSVDVKLVRERAELDRLRTYYQGKYPILKSFDQEHGRMNGDKLEQVGNSNASDSDAAEILLAELESKATAISEVEDDIRHGKVSIWRLPKVTAATEQAEHIKKGSWQSAVVKGSVADPDDLANKVLSTLSIVLSVAGAFATGGVSLAIGGVALVIDLVQVVKDVEAYQLNEALANTDFDRAHAIGESEPDLFWLAVNIAGVVLSVKQGIAELHELAGPARALMRATSEEEKSAAIKALRNAAEGRPSEAVLGEIVSQAERSAGVPPIEAARRAEKAAVKSAAAESAEKTKYLDQITAAQGEAELEQLAASPDFRNKGIGYRKGKVGEHTWTEEGPGIWCRHSHEFCIAYYGLDDGEEALEHGMREMQSGEPDLYDLVRSAEKEADENPNGGWARMGRREARKIEVLPPFDIPDGPLSQETQEKLDHWWRYVAYRKKRNIEFKEAGANAPSVKAPLTWESYEKLLVPARGMRRQREVTAQLANELGDAWILEANVGVSVATESGKHGPVKFVDGFAVRREDFQAYEAAVSANKPLPDLKVTTYSMKSRDFSDMESFEEVSSQVEVDLDEAFAKYYGEGELVSHRPNDYVPGPNASQTWSSEIGILKNKKVKVEKVVLVYDSEFVSDELEKQIRSLVARIAKEKKLAVEVVFK